METSKHPGILVLAAAAALLLAPATAGAQSAPVEIKNVKFDNPKVAGSDEWVEMEIEIQGGPNPDADARNARFVDDIKLTASVAYEISGGKEKFLFFQSEVEIATLEQGKTAIVQFYIPPEIRERDGLPRKPFAYHVGVEVGGKKLRDQKEGMHPQVRKNPSAYLSQVSSNAGKNEGVMKPVYDTLFWDAFGNRRLRDVPSYIIRPRR